MEFLKLLENKKTYTLAILIIVLCIIQGAGLVEIPEELWLALLAGTGITLRAGVKKAETARK